MSIGWERGYGFEGGFFLFLGLIFILPVLYLIALMAYSASKARGEFDFSPRAFCLL